jgi:hypothetical protein
VRLGPEAFGFGDRGVLARASVARGGRAGFGFACGPRGFFAIDSEGGGDAGGGGAGGAAAACRAFRASRPRSVEGWVGAVPAGFGSLSVGRAMGHFT